MTLRQEFLDILGNWSQIQDLEDIPRRIKRIEKFMKTNEFLNREPITEQEQSIVTFMKDVQATREFVRRKIVEEVDDDND